MSNIDKKKGTYDVEQLKKENAVLRKYAAMQAAAEEKIGCQMIYVDIAGGIEEAFVLDELIFFTLPRPETGRSGLRVWKEGVLWMAVSRTEWWERKRMTAKQADGAIERLVKSGLVLKELFLFNKQKTTHLRLNIARFFELYAKELEKRNPPEDESDTMLKDIQDLYEMLGIPKSNTPEIDPVTPPQKEEGIPESNTASLNGDSLNIPHTPSTQPLNTGTNVPHVSSMPIDWQMAAGVDEVVIPDQTEAQRRDMSNRIAIGCGANMKAAYDLAMTFQNERGITFTQSDINGQRKAIKSLLEKKVQPSHVAEAVRKLQAAHMTIVDLFGVIKTAVDIASQPGPEPLRML